MARSSPGRSCVERWSRCTRTSSGTRSTRSSKRSSITIRCRWKADRCPKNAPPDGEYPPTERPAMYLLKKGNAPNQAHVGVPEGLHEEEHGRQGFSGPASHLYRRHPPTAWVRIDGPLRPRAFSCASLHADDASPGGAPVEILRSADAAVFLSRRTDAMPYFVRNADGDELYFVHIGRGRFETDYGVLPYEPGDYVLIPKGTTYRVMAGSGPSLFLIVETPAPLEIPDRGLLGHHALFDLGVVSAPELADGMDDRGNGEWEVR